MINLHNKSHCCGCSACANVCPKRCITMVSDNEGFLYPKVDTAECVDCGLCENVCPIINKPQSSYRTKAFGCYNKDDEVRLNSSSGGVFCVLCKYIVEVKKGVVFGAEFDDDFNVHHKYAETMEDCKKFRGSKYVQSIIGERYKEAKRFLDDGRFVLFTGTPCQIAGLHSYLKKPYDRLYTQDIACHSVPSPKIWDEYKKYISKGRKIKNICFRDKKTGWESPLFLVDFDNDTSYKCKYFENEFIRGFVNGLYSRPSCYECKFSSIDRCSDITLADFWGVSSFYPELNDKKGTSLVLVHSKKGVELFKYAKMYTHGKRVNLKKSVWYNSAVCSSVPKNPNRENFYLSKEAFNIRLVENEYKFENDLKEYNYTFIEKLSLKIKSKLTNKYDG